jgi:chitinase
VADEGGQYLHSFASYSINNVPQKSDRPPAAEIDHGPLAPETDETVVFDGIDSSDTDGTVDSYQWEFGDGTTETGAMPSHSYGENGTYTVNLTVTDDDGATRTTSRDVAVRNRPPTADFDFSPANPQSGDAITFDASGSSDSDGTIDSYRWNLTDDTGRSFTTTGETVTATSLSAGSYVMALTVTDDDRDTDEMRETIVIESDNSGNGGNNGNGGKNGNNGSNN